uniref:Uncharacterized protein n=1 Tax=Arundo donax TaxID=35708 RepID=A0A0A8Z3I3_ARUDO
MCQIGSLRILALNSLKPSYRTFVKNSASKFAMLQWHIHEVIDKSRELMACCCKVLKKKSSIVSRSMQLDG